MIGGCLFGVSRTIFSSSSNATGSGRFCVGLGVRFDGDVSRGSSRSESTTLGALDDRWEAGAGVGAVALDPFGGAFARPFGAGLVTTGSCFTFTSSSSSSSSSSAKAFAAFLALVEVVVDAFAEGAGARFGAGFAAFRPGFLTGLWSESSEPSLGTSTAPSSLSSTTRETRFGRV